MKLTVECSRCRATTTVVLEVSGFPFGITVPSGWAMQRDGENSYGWVCPKEKE